MRHPGTRWIPVVVACGVLSASTVHAEVTKVTIASRAPVAGGQAFGSTGPYEKLTGTIEFALDPADPHNGRLLT